MRIYPAIDIRGGKAVRLRQGSFSDMTVYNDDPLAIAREFKELGADFIHVVDLDAAKDGVSANLPIIASIVKETGLKVQTGGGIRDFRGIEERLAAGLTRVIIGTRAVREPEFVGQAIKKFGADRIVAGLDGKGSKAATNGWEQESGSDILQLALKFADMGLKTVVYTDITKDGMLTGPNFDYTARLVRETGLDIIASGGIGSSEDLARAEAIGVEGAIVGKAFYEGRVDLKEEFKRRQA